MRLTLSRRQVPTQRVAEEATAPPRPLYEVVSVDDRLDLNCTVCGTAIAVGVREDRVIEDAPFFLDAHSPFCLRVTRR